MQDVGAAIWAMGKEGVVTEWLGEQLQVAVIDTEADKENGGLGGIVEWFGRRFVVGVIEVSGLCRMVWQFGRLQ